MNIGSSSGSLYFFGLYNNAGKFWLAKTDTASSVIWGRSYDKYAYFFVFQVDPSETNIYVSHDSSTYYPLNKMLASDGSVVTSKQIATTMRNSASSVIRFYSANVLYFSAWNTGSRTMMCSTDVTAWTSAQCLTYSSQGEPQGVLPLSSTDLVFIASGFSNPKPISVAR